MQEESETEEGYQTEWDSLLYGDNDPLETKTWWGGVIRTATEVGTTLGLIVKNQYSLLLIQDLLSFSF